MRRTALRAVWVVIAGLTASSSAIAAFPSFDPESKCSGKQPHRSPDGYIYKSCTQVGSFPLFRPDSHMLERFLPSGKLDPSWGTGGRATIDVKTEAEKSCGDIAPDSTILFPPDGRILLYAPYTSRLRAFRANGDEDTSYGENGVSAPLCNSTNLIGLDLLADGRVAATSTAGHFVVHLLRADGSAASEFGIAGRADYSALSFPDSKSTSGLNVKAWSLQQDGSLQVSYLYGGLAIRLSSPGIQVFAQSPGQIYSLPVANRVLPQRGPVFHIADVSTSFRVPTGGVYTLLRNSPMLYLPNGGAISVVADSLSNPLEYAPRLVRFTPTGKFDPSFEAGSFTGIRFVSPSPNCPLRLRSEQIYLQPDGSLVYAANGYYYDAGTNAMTCESSSVPVSLAAKYLPDGRLDPDFPQMQDPALSGAKFTTDSPEWTAVEYYSPKLDRYFFTPHPLEADAIDRDVTLRAQGWWRTGKNFGVWNPDFSLPGTVSACRFAADPIVPPKSFYDSILDKECDILREQELATPPGQRAWRYDRESFRATPPLNGVCPSSLVPIYSLYNQGHERGIDSNFRYVDNLADFNAMIDRGWVGLAQPQFCARPD